MDIYHIALFLHIVTLIVAASVTAVTKLAATRRARARTVADALDWHNVLVSSSRAFPVCLVAFVATGAYMVSVAAPGAWASGFVVAGLVGVLLLLASGTYLGVKGKALTRLLESIAAEGADRPAPPLMPTPLVAVLPVVNTGIALSVVFDMVVKPASATAALGLSAAGAGRRGALRRKRGPATVARDSEVAPAA
jgi:hypothetical protein